VFELTTGLRKLDIGTRFQAAVGFREYVCPVRDTYRHTLRNLDWKTKKRIGFRGGGDEDGDAAWTGP
jgi:hypothetical protein